MFARLTGARQWPASTLERTASRPETSAGRGTGSFAHPRDRVSVFERRAPRAGHESSWTQRLVLAVITIDLPAAQSAPGIDNFPSRAAEGALNFGGRGFQNGSAAKATRSSWR